MKPSNPAKQNPVKTLPYNSIHRPAVHRKLAALCGFIKFRELVLRLRTDSIGLRRIVRLEVERTC